MPATILHNITQASVQSLADARKKTFEVNAQDITHLLTKVIRPLTDSWLLTTHFYSIPSKVTILSSPKEQPTRGPCHTWSKTQLSRFKIDCKNVISFGMTYDTPNQDGIASNTFEKKMPIDRNFLSAFSTWFMTKMLWQIATQLKAATFREHS